MITLEQDHLD